jgi:putative transposase
MSLGSQEDQNAEEHHKSEEIVAKRRRIDATSQRKSVADAIRAVDVTEVTYYRWRQEYGGLRSDQVKRMKDLEAGHPPSARGL